MAYKIVWMRGGETAERYTTKKVAQEVLRKSNLTGRIVKVKLGSAGTTMPSTRIRHREGIVGSGVEKLKWVRSPNGVIRKSVVR